MDNGRLYFHLKTWVDNLSVVRRRPFRPFGPFVRTVRPSLILYFLILFTPAMLISEEPWGPDADLARPQCTECICLDANPTLLARLGERAIRFHQEVISPADGPRSHFIPSSSQYTLEAMRKYGFFRGFTMGCDRLMRENSEEWVYRKTWDASRRYVMKWDPVP